MTGERNCCVMGMLTCTAFTGWNKSYSTARGSETLSERCSPRLEKFSVTVRQGTVCAPAEALGSLPPRTALAHPVP